MSCVRPHWSAPLFPVSYKYDTYCKDILEPAQQLNVQGWETIESIRQVQLKYCIDAEYLESALFLGLIGYVENYDDFDDDQLREFFESKSTETK